MTNLLPLPFLAIPTSLPVFLPLLLLLLPNVLPTPVIWPPRAGKLSPVPPSPYYISDPSTFPPSDTFPFHFESQKHPQHVPSSLKGTVPFYKTAIFCFADTKHFNKLVM